jgi:methylated-DNA-[protein]-cysteine S-methyltransferase
MTSMRVTTMASPMGRVEVCEAPGGVRGVVLTEDRDFDPEDADKPETALSKDIARYFAGEPVDFNAYPVDLGGYTPFEVEVLEAVRGIPYGATKTYDEVANELEKPHHGKVVAHTLHRNRINIVIPGHRVVRGSGDPGDFEAGAAWKTFLLGLEGSL